MKCEIFNDRLPEYLDESLPQPEQVAAREHVRTCGTCQRALALEVALAKFIRISFDREVQGLSLAPETRKRILAAAKPRESWLEFFAVFWRHPVWASAVVLCVAVLIFGSRFRAARPVRDICVVNVPIRSQTHFQRTQKGLAVDDVVTDVTVIDAVFSENINHSKL
jgi:hypothetical protein